MISNNLSKLLGEKRMTQSKLSEITGIRRQAISDIYHGINISIKMEHLDLLCSALDCKIEDIFIYTPTKKLRK